MYYLIVERPENWEADRQNGFVSFGLKERNLRTAERLSTGDFLITYISGGVSCFSDARVVIGDKVAQALNVQHYDDMFPLIIKTAPDIVLSRENWVPVKSLLSKLEFSKGVENWRQLFRASIRVLNEKDGRILHEVIRQTQKSSTA